MARMPSKRWDARVARAYTDKELTSVEIAIKLLSRQHNEFVRLVKKCQCDPEDGQTVENGYNQAKADILAALKQGGTR